MRRVVYMLRFFWLVAPLPPLMAPAMIVAGAVATAAVAVDPGRAPTALTPLLLLQMFAASSGFMVPARRGHYDLLLTGGGGRVGIAAAHWAVSVAPGVAVYLAVAGAVRYVGSGEASAVHGAGAWLALALVSTLPWAATVALPRFTAAIAWLLLIALAVALLDTNAPLLAHPLDGTAPGLLAAGLLILNPVALVGVETAGAPVIVLLPVLLLAAGSMAAAMLWAARQDVPLEAPQ